jgi:uncharacterized protein YbjT (DUF2867 family)
MKTALIAGATGLIGKQVLGGLLASKRYTGVVALTRSTLAADHPKFRNIITDFHRPEEILSGVNPDDVFCCLGTTMAKAGSREKFYEVDFQFPLSLAKATSGLGAKQFLLVSALGADRRSSIYYNRVKGEVETAIRAVPFDTLHIFRPSLLLGERPEKRAGEDAAKLLYKIFAFAIPEKYKAISAEKVADAMLTHASKDQKGIFVHESREMQKSP